ncbi:MAG: outer membrane lipoprotein chaperone LolA [Terriglobia bacterium]
MKSVICLRALWVRKLSFIFFLAASIGVFADTTDPDLENSIKSLQKRYASVQDLKMEFFQNYKNSRRAPKTEAGILYLRRPGMMRWEYKTPTEKLFISNGKVIYFYLPGERQVQKTRVRESNDQRIPFLFLLGKGNLKRDFSKIEWASDLEPVFPGNKMIYAYPKQGIDEFSKILMEFDPYHFQLQRVTVFEIDGATSEFVFTHIQENQGTKSSLFDFKIPPGVEVLENDKDSGMDSGG